MASSVNTAYRSLSVTTLTALLQSALVQLKAIEGTGQSHSANSRTTNLADRAKLMEDVASLESALEWKRNPANAGNNGYARRFASFNTCGNGETRY